MSSSKKVAKAVSLLPGKNIYVRETPTKGWGVFAKRSFQKDEMIFVIRGKIVRDSYDSQYGVGPRWISIGPQKWLAPFPHNGLWYLNHSCSPNAGRKGLLKVVAMRKIEKDEEITLDYATTEEDPYWKMKCRCSEKNCRKLLRGIQSLPHRLFKKYEEYITAHLRRAYKKAKLTAIRT